MIRDELLSGWGRTAPTRASVSRPPTAADVAMAIDEGHPRGLLARGLGRSYGDAAQNAGGRVLDMTAMSGVRALDAAAGTVSVYAGTSLDEIIRHALPLGWFLPVSPGTRFVTAAGAIANDIHGKNHHREGSIGDHVVSFELITPDGDTRTVTPQTEPELFAATCGGLGLTGIITEVTLKLLRVQTSMMRVDTERAGDLDDLMARMEAGDHLYRYSVAWVDCMAKGRHLGRSVLTRGDHAVLDDDLDAKTRREPLALDLRSLPPVPPGVPSLINGLTARAFNELWFRKAPAERRDHIEPLAPFFYPLDAAAAWNRLYGPRGFLQYQFVVPFGEEAVVREALESLAGSGCPSFLGVLKRFGPGHGFLSFPMPGWTLALDIPASADGLGELLDTLDRRVADAGGRVYLAKDSRLAPETVARMYPELDRWREVRERLDPGHLLRSDIDRRLGLSHAPSRVERKAVVEA